MKLDSLRLLPSNADLQLDSIIPCAFWRCVFLRNMKVSSLNLTIQTRFTPPFRAIFSSSAW